MKYLRIPYIFSEILFRIDNEENKFVRLFLSLGVNNKKDNYFCYSLWLICKINKLMKQKGNKKGFTGCAQAYIRKAYTSIRCSALDRVHRDTVRIVSDYRGWSVRMQCSLWLICKINKLMKQKGNKKGFTGCAQAYIRKLQEEGRLPASTPRLYILRNIRIYVDTVFGFRPCS